MFTIYKMEKSAEVLEAMFQKANSDLNYLSRKVEFELENSNADGETPNPAKMLQKISDIKKEYAKIAQDAIEIQRTQKESVDFFRSQLLSACQMVQKLSQQTGIDEEHQPVELSELSSLLNFDDKSKLMTNSLIGDNVEDSTQESATTSLSSCNKTTTAQGELKSQFNEYIEVNEEEFNSVSGLIRGRVKLADVNTVYQVLWRHFKEEKNKKSLKTSDLHEMGLKVTGDTGEAKLKVLGSLKLIQLSSKGEVTFL